MPTTFGTPTYAGRSSGSSSLSIDRPADLADGDLLIVALRSQQSGGGPWGPPPGFDRIAANPSTGDTVTYRVGSIFVKRVESAAAEPSSYTFTGPGARAVGIAVACSVDLEGEIASVETAPYGGSSAAGGIVTLAARTLDGAPALSLVAVAAECTAGISHVPSALPSGYTEVGNAQSSLDESTAGTRTAIWLGWRDAPTTAADEIVAGFAGSSAPAIYAGSFVGGSLDVEEPEAPAPGFRSVAQMLATPGATWAHRGGSTSWPEHTELAYRNAALAGYGALEFSCARTSDGVWFGLHDVDINYTSGTSGLPAASAMTWAEVQEYMVVVNAGGDPQPYWKMTEFLDTYAQTHICIMDYKHAWQHLDEWFNILASYDAPQRIVIKQWGPTTDGPDIHSRVAAAGFASWGYFYEADALDGTMAAQEQYFTMLGMDYNASQAAWDIALSFGKPVAAHIAPSQNAYDTAIAKGAHMVQCSGAASIEAVGAPEPTQPWDAVYVDGSRIPARALYVGPDRVWP